MKSNGCCTLLVTDDQHTRRIVEAHVPKLNIEIVDPTEMNSVEEFCRNERPKKIIFFLTQTNSQLSSLIQLRKKLSIDDVEIISFSQVPTIQDIRDVIKG